MPQNAQNDSSDRPQGRANAGESQDPPATDGKRHRPLDTLDRVRKELSRVYWSTKDGVLPIDRAKGLVYILSQISATLKAEPDGDGELAALLAQVREKLKGGT